MKSTGNNNEMSQTSAGEGFGRVGGPGERPGSIAASSVYSDDLARGEGQPWGPTGDDADPFTALYTNEEGERFPSDIQPLRVGLAGQPASDLKRFSALQNYSYPATSARHQSILRDYSAWAAERGPGHDDGMNLLFYFMFFSLFILVAPPNFIFANSH